jgi:hypothetical protein
MHDIDCSGRRLPEERVNLASSTKGARVADGDRELLMILAFVVFFPFSAIFLVARWLIRRRKTLTQSMSLRS